MSEKIENKKTKETEEELDPNYVEKTPLAKLDSKKTFSLLSEEGFNQKEIEKILKSIKLLPHEKLEELNTMYQKIKDDSDLIYKTHKELLHLKNPKVATTLSVFTGLFGGDRFYIGDKSCGITKACSLGCIFIYYFYDIFTISKRTAYLNYLRLRKVMGFEEEEFD